MPDGSPEEEDSGVGHQSAAVCERRQFCGLHARRQSTGARHIRPAHEVRQRLCTTHVLC